MRACILAVGKFRRNLDRFLDHPAAHYRDCPEGKMLAVKIGHVEGEANVQALAQAFGVDLDKPATHAIGRGFRYNERTFCSDLCRVDFMTREGVLTESATTFWVMLDRLIDADFFLFFHLER